MEVNWKSIGDQLEVNWKSIGRQLEVNWRSIGCQLGANWDQLEVNWRSIGYQLEVNNMEINDCKNVWDYCGFLKNFGLLMHFDALINGILDFSLVLIMFAARPESIM